MQRPCRWIGLTAVPLGIQGLFSRSQPFLLSGPRAEQGVPPSPQCSSPFIHYAKKTVLHRLMMLMMLMMLVMLVMTMTMTAQRFYEILNVAKRHSLRHGTGSPRCEAGAL
eukprot:TRINITY_DN5578_c0_g1_i1.p6 TRINITY_DN5578_c0_g1~~TRINITY_DN5578_c0_g1_i1.p6  ORF type:complete len:110 (+),score=0.60 TRINITY_DN5578_c0_g1_i1:669-998(+)